MIRPQPPTGTAASGEPVGSQLDIAKAHIRGNVIVMAAVVAAAIAAALQI